MTIFDLPERDVVRLVTSIRGDLADTRPGDSGAVWNDAVTGTSGAGASESGASGTGAPETGASDDIGAVAETFARAAWTCIAEPGDGVAGVLIGTLGARAALDLVLGRGGPARVRDVLASHGLAGDDDDSHTVESIVSGLERWRPRLRSPDIIRAMEQAARVSARLLMPGDELWPSQLDDLGAHGPTALWWRGSPGSLQMLDHSVALVGARAATGYGEQVAMEAAAGLVDRGFAIVSGAAYGIDGMAHRAALASNGVTVAFLAGGVDRFYPSGHDALLTRISEVGAVMSELPCGQAPTKWRFLQRNRLIAASGEATVVVEAGWRSGSLNTAGHAATLGRPLGAVPGPVTSPSSAGCHRLIREYDAVCVTSAEEMAALARGEAAGESVAPRDAERTSDETRLIDALSARSARGPADVARRSGLAVHTVTSTLGSLELDGVVRERDTGWVLAPVARARSAR